MILKIRTTLVAALASAASLQAAIVSFSGFDANGSGSPIYNVTIDDTGLDIKYNFTFTGDIDGCEAAGVSGAADDTFSFTLTDKFYEGSTFSGDSTTSGALALGVQVDNVQESGTTEQHFGYNDNIPGTNAYLSVGDSFELSMSNISYSRGEASVDETATFQGFDILKVYYTGNDDAEYLVGNSGMSVIKSDNLPADQTVTLGGAQSVLFTQTASSGDNSRLRVRNIDFSFEVADSHEMIPEPSSALLLAFGVLSFTARRCR